MEFGLFCNEMSNEALPKEDVQNVLVLEVSTKAWCRSYAHTTENDRGP